jgi:maltose alpha-D-glucosyltransferase / alpha-amylase
LRQRRNSFGEADRAMIDELLAQQDKLHVRLNELMPPGLRSLNMRLHGDFHLGRVLIVKDDVFFTGFEGDARRPLEERRRKAPAARDVASMIWSIEASSHAARGRAPYLAPDENGRLGKALTEWVERATGAFMASYREPMTFSSIWPADSRAMQPMVDFFLLEKAFDVLETELHQRVEAAPAAIARILRILSQPAREAA